ncbi:hypothetical protein CAEBREN_23710 [Caenorhabditis brenneri]|uniref:Uncharacterized protein n=1 Tax=Caenorhabditis brenneri TaxID=135651 RepID=G0MDF6_CAEBE|nr:hypothetical protein CAEBREN_23710 [Caenorhabditis brenneri]
MSNYPDTMNGMRDALDEAHREVNHLRGVLAAEERLHHEELQTAQEKIENLFQKTMDDQRHLEEMERAQEQSTARIAFLQGENATLRLEAAADVLLIQNATAQEIAGVRLEAARQQAELRQQHTLALVDLEDQMSALQNERNVLRRDLEFRFQDVEDEEEMDRAEEFDERIRELEAFRELFNGRQIVNGLLGIQVQEVDDLRSEDE